MENEYIKYETAILAKEKGVFVNTPMFYHNEKLTVGELLDQNTKNMYSAFTQYQLQRILRDDYNIIVSVDINESKRYFISVTDGDYMSMYGKHETWEKALEVGLVDALNMIR